MAGKVNNWPNSALSKHTTEIVELGTFKAFTYEIIIPQFFLPHFVDFFYTARSGVKGDTAPQKPPPVMGGKLTNWPNIALSKHTTELEELGTFTAFTYEIIFPQFFLPHFVDFFYTARSGVTGDTAPQKPPSVMGGKINNCLNSALSKHTTEIEELGIFTAFTYDIIIPQFYLPHFVDFSIRPGAE